MSNPAFWFRLDGDDVIAGARFHMDQIEIVVTGGDSLVTITLDPATARRLLGNLTMALDTASVGVN